MIEKLVNSKPANYIIKPLLVLTALNFLNCASTAPPIPPIQVLPHKHSCVHKNYENKFEKLVDKLKNHHDFLENGPWLFKKCDNQEIQALYEDLPIIVELYNHNPNVEVTIYAHSPTDIRGSIIRVEYDENGNAYYPYGHKAGNINPTVAKESFNRIANFLLQD